MNIEQDLYFLASPSELELLSLLLDQGNITEEDVEKALNKKKKPYRSATRRKKPKSGLRWWQSRERGGKDVYR